VVEEQPGVQPVGEVHPEPQRALPNLQLLPPIGDALVLGSAPGLRGVGLGEDVLRSDLEDVDHVLEHLGPKRISPRAALRPPRVLDQVHARAVALDHEGVRRHVAVVDPPGGEAFSLGPAAEVAGVLLQTVPELDRHD